jgi:hypothetical protein
MAGPSFSTWGSSYRRSHMLKCELYYSFNKNVLLFRENFGFSSEMLAYGLT